MLYIIGWRIVGLTVVSGFLLWFIGKMLAPRGTQISFWRGLCAAFVTRLLVDCCLIFLKPHIGQLVYALVPLVMALAIMLLFRLSFPRSLATAVIFWTLYTGVTYLMELNSGTPNKSLQPTATALSVLTGT